jgi:hypothetical protein
MQEVGLKPVTDFAAALALARRILGRDDYSITVMTQAANTVPLLADQAHPAG